MTKKIKFLIAAPILFASLVFAGGTPPEKTHGLDVEPVYLSPLGAQIPEMKGFEYRARRIVVNPGAATNDHSHADRPGIVYVVEGTLDEYRKGEKRVVSAGDTWLESAETVHWFENTSDKKAVILAFDLVKSSK